LRQLAFAENTDEDDKREIDEDGTENIFKNRYRDVEPCSTAWYEPRSTAYFGKSVPLKIVPSHRSLLVALTLLLPLGLQYFEIR
jgi:hypothetical protein